MVEESRSEDRLAYVEIEGQKRLATANMAQGVQVYGEKLLEVGDRQYRLWDPYRSKLAAAIIKGLKTLPITRGSAVLYLGASTGTTVSHVSDLVGAQGVVFAVEISARVAREFMDRVVTHRTNVIPILEDARRPELLMPVYRRVDVVYCDIAQADQTEIAILNCRTHLKIEGDLLLIVKSRSIDVTRTPESVFHGEKNKLERDGFEVLQIMSLEPFQKDHAIIHACMKTTQKT
jgi:fibrillarin-like pre-rRNA processing protein